MRFLVGFIVIISLLFVGFGVWLVNERQQKVNSVILGASSSIAPEVSTPSSLPTPVLTKKPIPTPISNVVAQTKQVRNMKITLWRWDEKGNPGNGIAYPHSDYPQTIHEVSAGTGTYLDPLSAAARKDVFPAGVRLYAPYIQKYLIIEDICGDCGDNHIDIWLNSDGRHMKEVDDCAGKYTKDAEPIELNPPLGRAISTSYLFDPATGICY